MRRSLRRPHFCAIFAFFGKPLFFYPNFPTTQRLFLPFVEGRRRRSYPGPGDRTPAPGSVPGPGDRTRPRGPQNFGDPPFLRDFFVFTERAAPIPSAVCTFPLGLSHNQRELRISGTSLGTIEIANTLNAFCISKFVFHPYY